MAYLHTQGRLHAIRPDSPGVREAAAAVLQKACEDRTLQAWLSSDHDTATMGTSDVQAVFDLLYAFRDHVSRVTGVRMPIRRAWTRSTRRGGIGGASGAGPLGSASPGLARP